MFNVVFMGLKVSVEERVLYNTKVIQNCWVFLGLIYKSNKKEEEEGTE
jgi:hypothetical protein